MATELGHKIVQRAEESPFASFVFAPYLLSHSISLVVSLATSGRLPVGVITGRDNKSLQYSKPDRRVPADPVFAGEV